MPQHIESKPTSKGERVKRHAYKVHAYHTHDVPSRRKPGYTVTVRCTRLGCTSRH